MSKSIPVSLTPVLAAVEAVAVEFEASDDFSYFGSNRWIRHLGMVKDDDVEHVAFLLDVAPTPLLAVYVVVRLPESSQRRSSLLTAISHANSGLLPGCFEIDLKTGATRYRSVLTLFSLNIAAHDVAQLLSGALLTTKAYASALQRVAASDVDPIETIDALETLSS